MLKDAKQVLLAQLGAVPCIAIQETRTCLATTIHGSDYVEFHSAEQKGDGGMALLFSQRQTYGSAQQRGLFSAREHVTCFLATPWLLELRVKAPFLQATIMAAHAPHSGRPLPEVQQWWQSLRERIPSCPVDELIVLVDSNARGRRHCVR